MRQNMSGHIFCSAQHNEYFQTVTSSYSLTSEGRRGSLPRVFELSARKRARTAAGGQPGRGGRFRPSLAREAKARTGKRLATVSASRRTLARSARYDHLGRSERIKPRMAIRRWQRTRCLRRPNPMARLPDSDDAPIKPCAYARGIAPWGRARGGDPGPRGPGFLLGLSARVHERAPAVKRSRRSMWSGSRSSFPTHDRGCVFALCAAPANVLR